MTSMINISRRGSRAALLAGTVALPLLAPAQTSQPPALPAGYELARVVSSTPVVQQVSEPQQVCTSTPVARSSGAGALLGAVAGGAVGNAIGAGSGNAAATALGVVGGAILGDRVEAGGSAPYVQDCSTQMVTRSVSSYNVVYEYAGKQYSVLLPSDPGPTLAVQVAPAVLSAPPQAAAQPVMVAPPPVYLAPPTYPPTYPPAYVYPYPAAYPYRYWPPIGINLGFGYYHHSYRHR
ncbi:MAG: hypothetical protein RJA36_1243 [Pseudomonadota bacterium]|jgi:uncharacterized protein YcfJ